MKYCIYCGAQLEDNSRFCTKCGQKCFELEETKVEDSSLEEQKRLEAEKLAEQKRIEEEARLAEEARIAEEKRLEEEKGQIKPCSPAPGSRGKNCPVRLFPFFFAFCPFFDLKPVKNMLSYCNGERK